MPKYDTTGPEPQQPISDAFDLPTFTRKLVQDLDDLRAGKISVRDAQARAVLAKHVLRSIHYLVMSQRFLENNARSIKAIPGSDEK